MGGQEPDASTRRSVTGQRTKRQSGINDGEAWSRGITVACHMTQTDW